MKSNINTYNTPHIEFFEVEVECGFASSFPGTEDFIENEGGWDY